MSWIAKSLEKTLGGGEDESSGDSSDGAAVTRQSSRGETLSSSDEEAESPPEMRGVREDLSELTRNLTRGLWGVASFLAPSPSSPAAQAADAGSEATEGAESPRLAGIRSDLEEIGGKLRSGISMLSNTKAVSGISKLASSILSFEDEAEDKEEEEEDEDEEQRIEIDAVGLTEDILIFARNIAMHPETWLSFPLLSEQGKSNDFEMSAAQVEHTKAVESIAPGLAALRSELCPSQMSEGCFWKIYFVLLHSRLSEDDAELLSTPQILETRSMLLQNLPSSRPGYERSITEATDTKMDAVAPDERHQAASTNVVYEDAQSKTMSSGEQSSSPDADIETENHPVGTNVVKAVDKSVAEVPVTQCKSKDLSGGPIKQHEVVSDDCSEEDIEGDPPVISIPVGQEEEISFSDLEVDDDEVVMNPRGKLATHGTNDLGSDSSQKTNESSDWLEVDKIDFE